MPVYDPDQDTIGGKLRQPGFYIGRVVATREGDRATNVLLATDQGEIEAVFWCAKDNPGQLTEPAWKLALRLAQSAGLIEIGQKVSWEFEDLLNRDVLIEVAWGRVSKKFPEAKLEVVAFDPVSYADQVQMGPSNVPRPAPFKSQEHPL